MAKSKTSLSRTSVVTPGPTCSTSMSSASAVRRPARRMPSKASGPWSGASGRVRSSEGVSSCIIGRPVRRPNVGIGRAAQARCRRMNSSGQLPERSRQLAAPSARLPSGTPGCSPAAMPWHGHEVDGMNDPRPFGAYAPSGFARWVDRAHPRPAEQAGRRAGWPFCCAGRDPHPPRRAGRRGGPRRAHAPLPLQQRLREARPLHAAVLRSPRAGAPFLAHPRRLHLRRHRREHRRLLALRRGPAGPTARILAVEPQPEIFDRLTYNIRLNPFGTIKAVDCAVADKPGELTLFLDPAQQRRIERQDRRIEPGRHGPRARDDASRSPQAGGLLAGRRDQARRGGRGGPDPRPVLPGRADLPAPGPAPRRGRAADTGRSTCGGS